MAFHLLNPERAAPVANRRITRCGIDVRHELIALTEAAVTCRSCLIVIGWANGRLSATGAA